MMRKNRLYLLVGGAFLLLVILGVISLFVEGPDGPRGPEGIAEIRIDGVITANPPVGIAGQGIASAPRITGLIDRAARDPRVKGMLLVINSPGGSAAGSQEIYRELLRFKETGKPVVVSMGEMAASGGYYISAPADYIMANQASITGSIGAAMEFFEISELLDKLGVEINTITAGELKDAGSLNRPLSAAEEEYFQAMVDEIHKQFIEDVLAVRSLDEETAEKVFDARIVLGTEAKELGLIDGLGNANDARRKLSEMTGLPEVPPAVQLEEKTFLDRLFSLQGDIVPELKEQALQLFSNGIRLVY